MTILNYSIDPIIEVKINFILAKEKLADVPNSPWMLNELNVMKDVSNIFRAQTSDASINKYAN